LVGVGKCLVRERRDWGEKIKDRKYLADLKIGHYKGKNAQAARCQRCLEKGPGGRRETALGSGQQVGLAACGGSHGLFARINGVSVRGGGMSFDGLGRREKRNGLDVSYGATACEGDADITGSGAFGEFGDGEDVEAAIGEKGGAKLAAK
jgi:hypothetical protein